MPQATEEQRARWAERDGGIGEMRPISFLKSRGYQLLSNYHWKPPTKMHQPTAEEYDAVSFMINEWDYGGIQRD